MRQLLADSRARRNRDDDACATSGRRQARVLDAYEHQQYTLGTLVRKLATAARSGPRAARRDPVQSGATWRRSAQLRIVDAEVEPNPKAFVNFDLFLNVIESEAGLRIDCDYNTDLFDAATIDRWLDLLSTRFSTRSSATRSQSVGNVELSGPTATRLVLARLNDTAADYPREPPCTSSFGEAQPHDGDRPPCASGTTK